MQVLRYVSVLISAAILVSAPGVARAVDFTWINSLGGNWTTNGNWDNAGNPDANDDTAILPNIAGAYTVSLTTPRTIEELNISGSQPTLDMSSNLTVDPVPNVGTTSNNSGTIDINSSTLSIVTNTFTQAGTILANGGTLRFGVGVSGISVNDIHPVVDWTSGSDITDPYQLFIPPGVELTVNRSSTWNFLAGQTLQFGTSGPGNNADFTTLDLDRDMTNSGDILMGRNQPGDHYSNLRMTITSTQSRLTNNADGQIDMFPRSTTSFAGPWSIRRLQAELINAGQFNIYTQQGELGKAVAGIDHDNTGTMTLNDSILGPTVQTPRLTVTGDSMTNSATGTIAGQGILDVSAITGGLTNDGTISPGMSAGILNVTGDVTNSSTSLLEIEIGGTTAGSVTDQLAEFDQLAISGTFNIDGDLVVTLIDGFENSVSESDVFTIATFSNQTGSFENVVDGRVNIADFFVGSHTTSFLVSIGTNSIVLSNFQIDPIIPEPSSLMLLGLGCCGLFVRRRRRGRSSPKRAHVVEIVSPKA